MTSLDELRKTVVNTQTALTLALVPILTALALWLGKPVVSTATIAVLLASIPLAGVVFNRSLRFTSFALAVALVGQTSQLDVLFTGHPWQVEMHFYYFAVLAMLSGLCDAAVLITAAALIAVHHLSLNFLLPAAIVPGGRELIRVIVPAIAV